MLVSRLTRHIIFTLSLLIVFDNVFAHSKRSLSELEWVNYKTKKHDQLGKILDRIGACPLWGHIGLVNLTNSKNVEITNKNIINLPEGIKIKLPVPSVSDETSFKVVNGELFILSKKYISQCSASKKQFVDHSVIEETPANQSRAVASSTNDENKSQDSDHSSSEIQLLPTFAFYRIDGKDQSNNTKSTLLSNLSTGLSLNYLQIWTERFKTGIHVLGEKIKFNGTKTKTVDNPSGLNTSIGISANTEITSPLRFNLNANYHERSYLRAKSLTELVIDKIAVPEFKGSLILELLKKQKFNLFATGSYYYLLSTSNDTISTKNGTGWGSDLNLVQNLTHLQLHTRFFYNSISQNSTLITQKNTEIGTQIGVGFELK